MGKRTVNAWQEKQKTLGRRAYTVFLDGDLIKWVKERAKMRRVSEADYMNKFMRRMKQMVEAQDKMKTASSS